MRGFISIMCGTLPSVIKPPQKWKMIDGNSKAEIQKAKYNQHDVHTCDWCTNSAYQWHFIHGDYVQMLHNDIWVIIIICTHIRKFLLFIKQNINKRRQNLISAFAPYSAFGRTFPQWKKIYKNVKNIMRVFYINIYKSQCTSSS